MVKRQNKKRETMFKQLVLLEFCGFDGYPNCLCCAISTRKESLSFDNLFCNIGKSKPSPMYDPLGKNENLQT